MLKDMRFGSLLVRDYGGHGKVLEVLQQTLSKNNIKNSNFMEKFHIQLKYQYKRAFSYNANDAKEIRQKMSQLPNFYIFLHKMLTNY